MALMIGNSYAIDEYYGNGEAWGQSNLKRLIEYGGYYVKNRSKIDSKGITTESMRLGDVVDTMLLHEAGAFNRKFYIWSIPEDKMPSEKELEIGRDVILYLKEHDGLTIHTMPDKDLLAILDRHSWQNKWKPETRLAKIREALGMYIEEYLKADGKTIISKELYMEATMLVTDLCFNRWTARYFNRGDLEQRKSVTVMYQQPIYWEEEVKYQEDVNPVQVKCKALLDIIVLMRDEEGRITSAQAIDLKTTSLRAKSFPAALRKFRYDIQAMFYEHALEIFLRKNFGILAGKTKIKPFQFIVASTSREDDYPVMLYTRNNEIAMMGRDGYEYYDSMLMKHVVYGYRGLLRKLAYYQTHDGKEEFDTEKQGSVALGWYTIHEDPFGDLGMEAWPEDKPNPKPDPMM